MKALDYELPWSGRPFRGVPFLAFDTETAVQSPDGREYKLNKEIPPIVLATVSDGERHVVLRPEHLPDFVLEHAHLLIVGHNLAFDYWVVDQCLHQQAAWDALAKWRQMPDQNLMDDTMLLDFLVRLADPNAVATDGMRNLGLVARLVGMEADKKSDYRLRFHELIGTDWLEQPRGFFDYAVEDTHVTWYVYDHLVRQAAGLALRNKIKNEVYERHGPLTSKLQTRASIVFSNIGRNGMCIDQSQVDSVREDLRQKVAVEVKELESLQPSIFSYYKSKKRAGEKKVNKKTQVPNLLMGPLRTHLLRAAEERGYHQLDLPKTPKGDMSTQLDVWRRMAPNAFIVRHWGAMIDTAKTLQFVVQVDGKGSVHPRYQTCVRTGRASAKDPNIMQMPKERWFRRLFVPRPGHKLVIVDYSAIELRTLAAVLLDMFGRSKLAEVLRQGICPHTYTASMVTGWSYDEIKAGVKAEKTLPEPGKYTKARQSAKAINFGVPGGLGVARLCEYARLQYGVEMEQEQARELRQALITEVYPELSDYLDYDIYGVLAENMEADRDDLQAGLEKYGLTHWHMERILRRGGVMNDGTQLPLEVRAHVWSTLEQFNQNPKLVWPITAWKADTRGLCGENVTTLTGRIRAGVDYGECRNTRFQGLASDGAKIALWNLFQAGKRIVAFIHDEVVAEVPDYPELPGNPEREREEIEYIMKESMASVVGHDIPIEVEGVVADAWTK